MLSFCWVIGNLFTLPRTVDIFPPSQPPSSSDHGESEEDTDISASLSLFVKNKTPKGKKISKNKGGRKAKWSQSLLGDLVDIIISSDSYKKKLIFTNTKNQHNGAIYEEILRTLKERASERGEEVPFNNVQLRTKFKKAVAECKKAALTIKTATGIKRFIEEKGYGSWFNALFAIVKTRDACRPELSVEPLCPGAGTSDTDNAASSSSSSPGIRESLEIQKQKSKKKKDDPVVEAIGLIKNVIENDPMKEMLSYFREEAEKAREHEMKMMQMVMQPTAYPGWQYTNQMQPSSSDPFQQGVYACHDTWSYNQ